MQEGWTHSQVGDIAAPAPRSIAIGPFGSSLRAEVYTPTGIPVIRGQNIGAGKEIDDSDLVFVPPEVANQFPACLVREGDLVFPHRGAIGRVAIVGKRDYLLSSSMMKLTPDPQKVDPTFLFYYFRGPGERELLSRASTVGTPGIGQPLRSLRGIPISYPPLPQQRGIAEVLGALDDKIAATAKLTAVASQLLDALATSMLRGAAASATVSELATVTKGVSYRRADLSDDSKSAMVTLKSITRDGHYSSSGLKGYIGVAKPAQHLQPGEIVVAQTDLTQAAEVVGRAVRVPGSDTHQSLIASLDLAIVRPRHGMSVEYLLAVLRSEQFRQHCRDRTSGTTVLHLGRGAIESFVAPIAESEAQAKYSAQARALHARIDSSQRESESLERLRDVILPLLMFGKIRVRDAERVVEGVV